jgi:hypothetical protein
MIGWAMVQVTNRNIKPLHQRFSELDNKVFSAFCKSFSGVSWTVDFKDNEDDFCGIDLQLTAKTNNRIGTYDVELKSVNFTYLAIDYCFFQYEKWYSLLQWDNEFKLYVAIYPYLDKIAVWRVNSDLLGKSEKEIKSMKNNTCKGEKLTEKLAYRFKFDDAKIFYVDLSQYRHKYDALYTEATEKIK